MEEEEHSAGVSATDGEDTESLAESEHGEFERSHRKSVEFQLPEDPEETEALQEVESSISLGSGEQAEEHKSFTDGAEEMEHTLTDDAVIPLRSSKDASDFLSSITPEELQLCLFADSLVTFSDSGREVGEFTVSVQRAFYEEDGKEEVECFLVHATSQGTIDGIPCGTSILAYISKDLETLEQHSHEYLKIKDNTLDTKTHLVKKGDKLVLDKVITEGQVVRKQALSFDWESMKGFVSEASNLLIMRVLAKRRVIPENMTFLAFDMESNLTTSTFTELGVRNQMIGKETVEMFGIERSIWSEEDLPLTWQCYFLSDGHLSSRVQVGSPVTMTLQTMPILVEKDEPDPKPVFGKQILEWEEDVQLYSRFLDRKEELRADHATYIRRHPDVRIILADFLQFVLLRKPDDIVAFAAEFFAPFASQRSPTDTFHTSYEPSPFRSPCP
ncbi:ciliogenesis-associated TTC17-interacting protein isoform X2 [Lissotriton helveticus]